MKNNMILRSKVTKKVIKSLMLIAVLLMMVPMEAREQFRSRGSQEEGVSTSRRATVSSRSRGAQGRTPQGLYAARTRRQRSQQQPVKKQTEQVARENVPPTSAPGSRQTGSTNQDDGADKWQKELDVLENKEASEVLEKIKEIREERPTLTTRQKADLSKLERIARLEIKLANLEAQQSGQPTGTQTAPENKPQQQTAQAEQPTAPVGGGPSVSTVRTNPFLVQQAPVTGQQVQPVVTTESKPQILGPIQQAWKEMPSASQMVYGLFGSDPKITQTPKVVSQPAPAKPVGALKQAYRDLPSFSSVLYQLGGGQDKNIINPKPQVAQEQPQSAPISEEDWKGLRAGLLIAAEKPSQQLIDEIEEIKNHPGLSNVQREELGKFQQTIKVRLSNPSLQTPTPPRLLPAPMPSNPFLASKVVPKVQQPTVDNPFSIPQKRRMSEEEWKQLKGNLGKSTFAFPSSSLIERIEEIKKTRVLSSEQLRWLNEQQRIIKQQIIIKEKLMPLSVPVQQQSPTPAPTPDNPFSRPQQQVSPVPQPQPEAISNEKWQEIRATLVLAAAQPSQKWVDKIEEAKKNPRLTEAQRDELIGFQQQIKAQLLNPFVQTPQPSAVVPEQKLHPLTGRPIDTKPKKPGPLQNLWPNWFPSP